MFASLNEAVIRVTKKLQMRLKKKLLGVLLMKVRFDA